MPETLPQRQRRLAKRKRVRDEIAERARAEGRVHTHDGARCKRCGRPTIECQDITKACSKCGQDVAVCAEAYHQSKLSCQAATTARPVAARGLIRAPSDAIVVMLQSAGVPVEWHMTRIRRVPANAPLTVCQEAWIPPEAVEIIRVDRPLDERLQALARLQAEYDWSGHV